MRRSSLPDRDDTDDSGIPTSDMKSINDGQSFTHFILQVAFEVY